MKIMGKNINAYFFLTTENNSEISTLVEPAEK